MCKYKSYVVRVVVCKYVHVVLQIREKMGCARCWCTCVIVKWTVKKSVREGENGCECEGLGVGEAHGNTTTK